MINVIFKHPLWWVIEKKAGVSVHNDTGIDVMSLLKKNYSLENVHLVNRLDLETSGLMVIALQSHKVAELQKSLTESEKKYVAVTRGSVTSESGIWNWNISDKAEGRNNPQGIKSDRVEAISEWKLLKKNKYLSQLEVIIKTGRQHQIRKHCALANHPILGDKRYNESKYNSRIQSIYNFDRMALHAWKLSFKDEGQVFEFSSPLPEEFESFF